MERDPSRIDLVLATVRKVWGEHPDLRLGQLLVNAIRPSEPCTEVFGVEDDALVRKLDHLAEQLRRAHGST